MTHRTCPECGAHLDPEEKCDCEHNAETGENDKKRSGCLETVATKHHNQYIA